MKSEFEQKLGQELRLTQAQFRVLETQQQALHQEKVEMQQQIDSLQQGSEQAYLTVNKATEAMERVCAKLSS